MKRFILLMTIVIVGVAVFVTTSSFWRGTSSEPVMVQFDAIIAYQRPSTFETQEDKLGNGEPACVPSSTVVQRYPHNEMVITGFTIWTDPPVTRITLREGIVKNDACVVAVQLPIRDAPGQTVRIGCSIWQLSAPHVTSSGNWNAGLLEYPGSGSGACQS